MSGSGGLELSGATTYERTRLPHHPYRKFAVVSDKIAVGNLLKSSADDLAEPHHGQLLIALTEGSWVDAMDAATGWLLGDDIRLVVEYDDFNRTPAFDELLQGWARQHTIELLFPPGS